MSLVSGGGGGNTAAPPAPPAPPSSAGATSGSQESIAHKLHLPWWPQGDTGKLRDAARAYRACATALTDAAEQGQRGISDITTANTGTAVTAIGTKWSGTYYGRSCLAAPSAGAPAFDNAIATCTLLAQACDDYAQHIDDAKHRLEELAAELVAGLVVGGLLTFVTAGLSDAAAVANAARVATAALELADTVGTYVTIAFRIGGLVIQGALVGAGSDLAMQAVRITAVPNTTFSFSELATATEFGAVLNPAVAGGAAALTRLPGLTQSIGAALARATTLAGNDAGSASVDLLTLGVTRLPAWLQRIRAGTAWHQAEQARLAALDPGYRAEVQVQRPPGAPLRSRLSHNRVDVYNESAQEIISLKHTQLSEITLETAQRYIDEAVAKYRPGTRISDVPSNGSTGPGSVDLRNLELKGDLILQVPLQNEPIPQAILDYAKSRIPPVIIRQAS